MSEYDAMKYSFENPVVIRMEDVIEIDFEKLSAVEALIAETRRLVRQITTRTDAFLIDDARARGRGRLAHLCIYAKKGRSRKRSGKRAFKGMHIAKLVGEPKLIYSDDDGWKDVLEW